MPKITSERAAELGRRGGRATVARHGREHMAAIGRRGFAATVARHFGGDRRRAVNHLIQRGLAAGDARYPEPLRKWRYDPERVPDRLPPSWPDEAVRDARAGYGCGPRGRRPHHEGSARRRAARPTEANGGRRGPSASPPRRPSSRVGAAARGLPHRLCRTVARRPPPAPAER